MTTKKVISVQPLAPIMIQKILKELVTSKKTSRKKLKKKTMHLNKELKDLAKRKTERAMSVFSRNTRVLSMYIRTQI